jgi:hypothetical protein
LTNEALLNSRMRPGPRAAQSAVGKSETAVAGQKFFETVYRRQRVR